MSKNNTVILFSNNGMGKGPAELQLILAGKYLELLDQHQELPNAICFYTEGIKLVIDGSPVLALLKTLEIKGVRLIVCSTCLDYFNLTNQLQVGILGGMSDIMEAQLAAEKVISL